MKSEPTQTNFLSGPYTSEDLWTAILLWGQPPPFSSIEKFRQRLAYWVRTGQIDRPIRQGRQDETKGTEGVYPEGTLDRISRLIEARSQRGKSRERLGKAAGESNEGQKLFSLGIWIPGPLAERIEAQVAAGHPLSEQLLIGTRLFHEAPEPVRRTVMSEIRKLGVVSTRKQDTRWKFACCFEMATHLLERVKTLAKKLRTTADGILNAKFEFTVIEGKVQIHAASFDQGDGTFKRFEM